MKRIVFLDYVRVFACFLVMLVHASENFYGAPGSTDMAGPQSLLATVAAIPAIAACTFVSCYVATKFLSLIPACRWMAGLPRTRREMPVMEKA